jgi:hypothetical protein
METNAALVQSHHLRQRNAVWVSRARAVRQQSRCLCQHVLELQTFYQHWYQYYLRVACAWCEEHIRWQSMATPMPVPMTSHGICPSCYATVTRELDLRRGGMPLTG